MSDEVTSPEHYSAGEIECIDAIWATGRGLDFCLGKAMKYLWRAGKKGDMATDLEKARFYLEFALHKLAPEGHADPRTAAHPDTLSSLEEKIVIYEWDRWLGRNMNKVEDFGARRVRVTQHYRDDYVARGLLIPYADMDKWKVSSWKVSSWDYADCPEITVTLL